MASSELIKPQDIRAALLDGKVLEAVTPEDVQTEMVRAILAADTIEDAARDFKATPMAQIVGQVVEVTGVAWMKSGYADGAPVYALIRCRPENSQHEMVVSCGGRTVLAFLLWAQNHKAMPFRCSFHREVSSANPEYSYYTVKLAQG